MFLKIERPRNRLCVGLAVNRWVDGKTCQKRLGYLGSVTYGQPIAASERVKFWLALPQRFSTIRARHPEGISIADEERIRAAINARIPRPTKRELQGAIDALVRQVDAISRAA